MKVYTYYTDYEDNRIYISTSLPSKALNVCFYDSKDESTVKALYKAKKNIIAKTVIKFWEDKLSGTIWFD